MIDKCTKVNSIYVLGYSYVKLIKLLNDYIYISCNSIMVNIIQLHYGTQYHIIRIQPAKIPYGTF